MKIRMMIIWVALALALGGMPAHGQTVYRTLTLDDQGKVVAPADFWADNAEDIEEVLNIASDAGNLDWSRIENTPTTLAGYGISDAVADTRTVSAGTGLAGGGALSGNITLALSAATLNSLGLADSAVQPGDLGALGTLDLLTVALIDATGTPTATTYLRGDGSWQDLPMARLYPVFRIPTSGAWTDFEIKGSVDGFVNLVYYYHSPDPTAGTVTEQAWDVKPRVWFTESGNSPRMEWMEQSTQAISDMLTDVDSVVGGIVVVVLDDAAWLAEDNADLQWSYVLMDGVGFDEDAADRQIWRPIEPVRWVGPGWAP